MMCLNRLKINKNKIWLMGLIVLGIVLVFAAVPVEAQEKIVFVTPPAEPTNVQIGLYLIAIDKISSPNDAFPTFEAEIFLDLQWVDPRLAFDAAEVGTDRKVYLEREAELQLEQIWWPDIELENGEGNRETENLELIISENGHVEYEEKFLATISVDFDLRQFPFDEQDLEIDIESFAWDERYVVFIPLEKKIGIEKDHAGTEWLITSHSVEIKSEHEVRSDFNFSEFIFKAHVERLSGYYLWRILPMFILIALSWSTFWMLGEPMPGRMGRSFIALLTVVGFHRIISDMMPRISYMTFLDGMILIAYLFTSVSIIENVLVNHYRVTDRPETAQLIDERAKWMIPLGFVVMCTSVGAFFLI